MWMMKGANGYTLDTSGTRFDAVVIDANRIVAVGQERDLRLQFGARLDRVMDVAGATVVPGLVDSHLHISGVAEQAVKLNLTGVSSRHELLVRVRDWASQLPDDAWILGGGWDDNRFAEKVLPTLAELDEASGGRPLFLSRVCYHAYLANSIAFAKAGIGESTPNPVDGQYGRDERGKLNGMVYENASKPLYMAIPPLTMQQWREGLRLAMRKALKLGLTAVHTDDVRSLRGFTPIWETYHSLIREEGIRLRVHELVDFSFLDECNQALRELPQPDDWLEFGAAKLFSDGALGGRTAWFSEAYSDAPGWTGTAMYPPEELIHRVRTAHEKGFGAAIHAIGDAALDATLTAMEQAPPVQMRDRIIHAEVVRPDLIERMVAMGSKLAIDIQPRFTVSDFPWIEDRIGPERIRYACAWRLLRNAGLHVAGGSDAPIEPLDPLLGIHAAVVRRLPDAQGPGYQMQEALSPEEAVRLFSSDACYANMSEQQKGVIAPGWLADFTVLDRDVVHPHDSDDLRDAAVQYTVVGGHVAFAADSTQME